MGALFVFQDTCDVALITFVPFTFIVLEMVLGKEAEKWIVPVVVMQTVAANLGSMLTPIGNMGRIPAFCDLLKKLIAGNEVATAIIASQFISNVPAALLLSGFTDAYDLLLIGTNLGGLGTIIASMASLISFKYIGREYKQLRGKYLTCFTVANVLFLTVLWGFYIVLAKGFTA